MCYFSLSFTSSKVNRKISQNPLHFMAKNAIIETATKFIGVKCYGNTNFGQPETHHPCGI